MYNNIIMIRERKIRLTVKLHRLIKMEAVRRDLTMGGFVEIAVRKYLEQEKKREMILNG